MAESTWRRARQRAGRVLKSPASAAKAWANRDRLGEAWDRLQLAGSMLKDWSLRRYPQAPWATLITVAAVLIYFLMPLDAVPDMILGAGLLDDLVVLNRAWRWIGSDLEKYRLWRDGQEEPDAGRRTL
ncbi:hypothetical protein A6D6_02621 [Alcanivorax xiamenensis]|uniref:DUF1232 domain-containing protein n=1 Tax=Alcanivorax xiamenensis TaxID=1177156 RepID=A0ABQ6Y6P4_9GAMM|nr:YkvA family protein [Alcanivorax xiamenensis]KAF0804989.1 hypothetical protein A6D6_02621 [Alcanivorax xiamenensis]